MVVLLVDGDTAKRAERAAALRARGHEVVEASGAQEAVTKSATPSAGIDVLVTEVVLPGGSFGFDLKDALVTRFPKLRVAYTTQYALDGYENDLDGHTPLPVTAKEADFLKHVEQAKESIPPISEKPVLQPGTTLGHYQILQFIYSEPETETYHALQYTVQRPVALVLLKPHLCSNPAVVAAFKERERVKASLSHPRVAPLFEAGEVAGHIYYTRELPAGQPLDALAAEGTTFNERVLADIIFRISHAMVYALEKELDYRPLSLRDIFVDSESQASIVNIFRPQAKAPRDQKADVQSLLLLLLPLTVQGKARGLLSDLAGQELDWVGLARTMQEIRTDMSERSFVQRAESENIALPSARGRWIAATIVAVGMVAVAILGGITGDTLDNPKVLGPSLITIPAGRFPAYRIGRYEVTLGQYAEFLEAVEGRSAAEYEHPRQPPEKTSHQPPQWRELYQAARTGGKYNDEPISLNHPVTRVDFWDAWAYCKWRGQRLPTEQEWEYAARGPQGFRYPWGDDPRPTDGNFGDDRRESDGGLLDGFNALAPVDQPPTDRSPFGILGMAGNVQEWTSTMATHPELPDVKVPVVRGGHYGEKSTANVLSQRYFPDSASQSGLARGFRTAEDVERGE